MTDIQRLEALADANGGVLTTAEVVKTGISKTALAKSRKSKDIGSTDTAPIKAEKVNHNRFPLSFYINMIISAVHRNILKQFKVQ